MELVVEGGKPTEFKSDALIVAHFEAEKGEKPKTTKSIDALDKRLEGLISASLSSGEFTGKQNQVLLLHTQKMKSPRLILVGLGKPSEFVPDKVRQAAGIGATAARSAGSKSAAFLLDSFEGKTARQELARLIAEGATLSLYEFKKYKMKDEEAKELAKLSILTEGDAKELKAGAETGEILADSANIARDICNGPGNYTTPEALAEKAKEFAKKYGFSCKVLEKKEIEREKMGGLLSVSSGSHQPPVFIVLEYSHGRKAAPIVLIGKGITFDSGGVSIKPSRDMDKMKDDKGGACAVLGAFVAVARMKLPVSIVGLIPATENMPGGSAARPGDIVKSQSGKTIEIITTDAEGRVVLADALSYSARFKPRAIIDLATLTGACVVALGYEASGLMGNDTALLKQLIAAGEKSGERVWRLPTWKEYAEYNKSEVADIKNSGSRGSSEAGTITAAKFLEFFVPEKTPWAHIDIAATVMNDRPKPYFGLGATGVGVRLLAEFLTNSR